MRAGRPSSSLESAARCRSWMRLKSSTRRPCRASRKGSSSGFCAKISSSETAPAICARTRRRSCQGSTAQKNSGLVSAWKVFSGQRRSTYAL